MEKLDILEARIQQMKDWIRQLKLAKSLLETEVKSLTEKTAKLEEENSHWDKEKKEIRARVERILVDIETIPD